MTQTEFNQLSAQIKTPFTQLAEAIINDLARQCLQAEDEDVAAIRADFKAITRLLNIFHNAAHTHENPEEAKV